MIRTISIFLLLTVLGMANAPAKTYKIGCVENYYPYVIENNNGGLDGIVIEYWKLWSMKADVAIEFVPLPDLKSCFEQVKSGKIDIIAGLFYSEERAKYLDFSEPLMRMQTIIFLKNEIKPDSIQNIEVEINLSEDNIAIAFMQQNYPQVKLKSVKSYATLLNSIHLKSIDGFVYEVPNPIGKYKQPPAPEGYYRFEVLFADRLRAAVKKGNSELSNLIILGVGKITDEDLAEIADKWDLFQKDKTVLWWIIGIGLLLIGIIIFLMIKAKNSRRKIKLMTDFETKTDWQVIVDKGENDLIEFKSSLRWDYRQEKVNKTLEGVITKTISAFLNTSGGMLFIGVDDHGNALGLDPDYNSLSKKNRDGFMLALTNLINQDLGKSTHQFISINFISLNDNDVCIVSVEESDKPVFCGKNEREEFYIRASASSQPLGMRETFKYINSRWGK